jgi:hypothetical protein
MSGRRRFICPNGFHRAMRLCFRAFDAMKLMTSGASPIAQMSGAVSKGPSSIAARNIHVGGDGRGALLVRPKSLDGALGEYPTSENYLYVSQVAG